jgi:hypothetical protein
MDFSQMGYIGALNQFNVSADSLEVANLTVQNITLSSVQPNAVLITNSSSQLDDLILTSGKMLMGSSSNVPIAGSILGTTNQVIVTSNPTDLTLSLPQSISLTSVPEFATVKVDNLIANQLVRTNASNQLDSMTLAVNGQLVIGSNAGSGPVAATLTPSTGISISNGQGTITIASTVTSALTPKTAVYVDASNNLASVALTDGQFLCGSTSSIPVPATITPVASQTTVTTGSGSIIVGCVQNIATSSTPTFKGMSLTTTGLSVNGGGISSSTTLAANALTNQIYLGSGNQTILNCPAPSITSTLTFPNFTDTIVSRNSSDVLTNKTLTGNAATNLVSGAATITLPTITSTLATIALTETLTNKTLTAPTLTSPTLNSTITTNLTASLPIKTNVSSQLIASAINLASSEVTGVLPIGNLQISAGSGIAVSGAGVISTTGAVTSPNITLTDDTNQILLGTTHTCQLTAPVASQAGNITLTLPPTTDTLVGRATTDTLTNKTIDSPYIYGGGNTYSTGTVSRTAATVTGSSTVFTQQMVGGIIVFGGGYGSHLLNNWYSMTSMGTTTSGTVPTGTSYTIHYNCFTLQPNGNAMGAPVYTFTNGHAMTYPAIGADDAYVAASATQFIANKGFEDSNYFTLHTNHNQKIYLLATNGAVNNISEYIQSQATTNGVIHVLPDSSVLNVFIMSVIASGTQTIAGTVNLSGNLTLATTGGTASNLNYYEEWASSGFTIGGPFAAQSINLKVVRIGKKCTLYSQGRALIGTNATAIMTVNTGIPARLYPADTNLRFLCSIISGASLYGTGHMELSSTTGVLTVYSDLNAGTFPTGQFAAVHPTSFSYITA